jgi:hypothetical protein
MLGMELKKRGYKAAYLMKVRQRATQNRMAAPVGAGEGRGGDLGSSPFSSNHPNCPNRPNLTKPLEPWNPAVHCRGRGA